MAFACFRVQFERTKHIEATSKSAQHATEMRRRRATLFRSWPIIACCALGAFVCLVIYGLETSASYILIIKICIAQFQLTQPLILRTRKARDYYQPSVIHLDSVIESEEEPSPPQKTLTPNGGKFNNDDSFFVDAADDDDDSLAWDAPTSGEELGSMEVVQHQHHTNDDRPSALSLQFGYKPPTSIGRMSGKNAEPERNGFYDMVLNVLETFHSAAEMEARQSRQRSERQKVADDRMAIFY